ncbi:MAG: CPBP family intramembrane metalloprotease [Fimbriimonadaceae bacterium]|nr:CPBP family intramembrane metalloprotease [Fimbriimonadaceae bacterium]QYK56005.1 MAG: CPBP family intramembrane metalloprotease [Fimbriimonadaceae bacterium]
MDTIEPGDVTGPGAPEREPRRFYWGWALLSILFAAWIGYALTGYFSPGESKEKDFTQERVAIRLTGVYLAALRKSGQTEAIEKVEEQYGKSLAEIRKNLFEERGAQAGAAEIVLVIDALENRPPDPQALEKLAASKDTDERMFGEAFQPGLEKTRAQELSRKLDADFFERLAGAQALEEGGLVERSSRRFGLVDRVSDPETYIPVVAVMLAAPAIVVVGLVVLALGVVFHLSKAFKPLGTPLGEISALDADRLALRVALALLCFAIVPPMVVAFFPPGTRGSFSTFTGMLVVFGAIVFMLRIPLVGVADPWPKLVGRVRPAWQLVGLGVLGFLANLPIVILLAVGSSQLLKNLPAPSHPVTEILGRGGAFGTIGLYLLVSLTAPLIEETMFRGMLFPALGRFMKPVAAGLLTGLLFASVHPQGPILWASLAAVGCMACYLTYMTGSLVPALVMHSVHNAAIVTLALALAG